MGADGGSIPRRAEMVKTKSKPDQIDDAEIIKTQWTCCFISKKPLESPIVACELGRLYNKEAVLIFLMNRDETEESLATELTHIKSLKNLINCKLVKSVDSEYFSCPVTGREMNGKFKFYVTRKCGCVLSEQALNQFPESKTCLVCERKDFDREADLIPIYPKGEELEKLKLLTKSAKAPVTIKKKEKRKFESGASLLFEEIKSSGEINTLKKSKVTETLYINKK